MSTNSTQSKHPAFVANVYLTEREGYWFATTVLTNGSLCMNGTTRQKALYRLISAIPSCYAVNIVN